MSTQIPRGPLRCTQAGVTVSLTSVPDAGPEFYVSRRIPPRWLWSTSARPRRPRAARRRTGTHWDLAHCSEDATPGRPGPHRCRNARSSLARTRCPLNADPEVRARPGPSRLPEVARLGGTRGPSRDSPPGGRAGLLRLAGWPALLVGGDCDILRLLAPPRE